MDTTFDPTTNLRTLITKRIVDGLLDAAWYGEWLGTTDTQRKDTHQGVVKSLDRINDVMLLKVYEQLYVFQNEFIPCLADDDGKFLNIRIKGYYGGMADDGSINT
jgi:hypothetical protein